jgi:hypothetical protein
MPPLRRRDYLKVTGAVTGVPFASRSVRGVGDGDAASGSDGPNPPSGLRTEYETAANNVPPAAYSVEGTDAPVASSDPYRPRFSWRGGAGGRGNGQSAYRILVASAPDVLGVDVGDVWDSGVVASDRSTAVTYGGDYLDPDETFYWKVRVWGDDGDGSSWSAPTRFTTAIPDTDHHWEGTWIGNHPPLGPGHEPDGTSETHDVAGTGEGVEKHEHSPQLRREFTLDKPVASARIHAVTLGYGELYVNGERVGDAQLAPGWTRYDHLALYTTHDVEEFLEEGDNALGVRLGRGWFSKTAEWPAGVLFPGKPDVPQYPTGVNSNWDSFGPPRALIQVNIEYEDGTTDRLASDTSWEATSAAAPSPLVENDVWDGETYDARNEHPGWAEPGFDAVEWIPAVDLPPPSESDYPVEVSAETSDLTGNPVTPDERSETEVTTLHPQRVEPIRVTESFEPASITEQGGGYVVDFGQNFAGWVELTVRGADAGDEIAVKHGENVREDGSFDMRSTRSADAIDRYVAKGADQETYEPRFTYHGFRYAKIEGYPGDLSAGDVTGKAVHTSFRKRASFACSNEELNQVQHASEWTLRSNIHSLPTDCPQRDERLGWTGDGHMSVHADLYNFDAVRLYEKWLCDHAVNQFPSGNMSDTVPHGWGGRDADPNWAKTRVTVAWALYRHTGDERLLETHYEGMKAYVDYWHEQANDHIVPAGKSHYGDHLSPDGRFAAPRALMNTFALYQTTEQVANAAAELGRTGDAEEYRGRAAAIAEAFNEEFLDTDTGVYGSGTQTSYVLPLHLGIVPDEHEERVVENLVDRITTEDGGTLQTGFVGTRPLLASLVEYGHEELAYHVVSQPERPGWVYMIRNGATTLWEAWNTLEELDREATLTSLNHRNWPLVSEWFYRHLAGIQAGAPGFEHVVIDPVVPADLEWAEGSVDTVRGQVASRWERTADGLDLVVTIPWNATGTVRVPDRGDDSVTLSESGRRIWNDGAVSGPLPDGIKSVTRDDDAVVLDVGSGTYRFSMTADGTERGPPAVEPSLTVSGSREDDGSVFTGGQTNRIRLTIEANQAVTVRDALPDEWTVIAGDPRETYEADGQRYVEFEAAVEQGTLTYLVEAPEGPTATGQYVFGPVEVSTGGDAEWVTVAGTTDTNRVVGPGS